MIPGCMFASFREAMDGSLPTNNRAVSTGLDAVAEIHSSLRLSWVLKERSFQKLVPLAEVYVSATMHQALS